jgi:hypothetical protein
VLLPGSPVNLAEPALLPLLRSEENVVEFVVSGGTGSSMLAPVPLPFASTFVSAPTFALALAFAFASAFASAFTSAVLQVLGQKQGVL